MSLLKTIRAQLGISATATQNFTLDASASDGTMKLARGNAGATTQDILTVDASGNVLVGGNNLNLFSTKSLAVSGYQKLPSGLIIQWGSWDGGPAASGTSSFPIAFPNEVFKMIFGVSSIGSAGFGTPISLAQYNWNRNSASSCSGTWIALGR